MRRGERAVEVVVLRVRRVRELLPVEERRVAREAQVALEGDEPRPRAHRAAARGEEPVQLERDRHAALARRRDELEAVEDRDVARRLGRVLVEDLERPAAGLVGVLARPELDVGHRVLAGAGGLDQRRHVGDARIQAPRVPRGAGVVHEDGGDRDVGVAARRLDQHPVARGRVRRRLAAGPRLVAAAVVERGLDDPRPGREGEGRRAGVERRGVVVDVHVEHRALVVVVRAAARGAGAGVGAYRALARGAAQQRVAGARDVALEVGREAGREVPLGARHAGQAEQRHDGGGRDDRRPAPGRAHARHHTHARVSRHHPHRVVRAARHAVASRDRWRGL